jgi:hypothetical protein
MPDSCVLKLRATFFIGSKRLCIIQRVSWSGTPFASAASLQR